MAVDPEVSALRTEFQGITIILSMVTAENNAGHSTLPLHDPYSRRTMLDMNNRSMETLMSSIASLLVRKDESVAVTRICPQAGQSADDFVVVAQNERGEEWGGEEGSNGGCVGVAESVQEGEKVA